MNLQSLSYSIPTSNPPVLRPCLNKSVSSRNSAYGSSNVVKWVLNSQNNIANFGKPGSFSRFNLGFSNMSKWVSEGCSSFRKNGGDLVRVRCGGLESGNGEHEDYMRRCVGLARQAVGCTSPNPMVGCVIVKDGKVVGQGFHPKAGQPHAEVFALRNAGELAENATAYVSLEPCNHYGRTPPCTEALIKAKVKKVVVGMVDPNPIVASKGVNKLREAGIEVIVGVEEDLCKKLNEAYIHKMLSGKPFVTVRYSISINGVLLDQLGEEVMKCGGYYSQLLQEYDAVIHAPTTTTQEFSCFTSYEPNARQPLHILIAKNPTSPIKIHNLPSLEEDFKAIIFAEKEVTLEPKMSQMGIEKVIMDHISLDAILEYCSKQGLCSVLVDLRGMFDDFEEIIEEGFETNLLQKVVVEVAPFWVSGERSGFSSAIYSLTRRKSLKNLSPRTLGNSVLLEGYF